MPAASSSCSISLRTRKHCARGTARVRGVGAQPHLGAERPVSKSSMIEAAFCKGVAREQTGSPYSGTIRTMLTLAQLT